MALSVRLKQCCLLVILTSRRHGIITPHHAQLTKSLLLSAQESLQQNSYLLMLLRQLLLIKISETCTYHSSSSPNSSSLVNALKHSYKSIGSVCSFMLLSTLSCSVDTFSCELWYLRCSVVGSHSIAMYELLLPNSCSLHLMTQPWQNLQLAKTQDCLIIPYTHKLEN